MRVLACLIALLLPAIAHAQAALDNGFGGPLGFGTNCMPPNDDGSFLLAGGAGLDLTPMFPRGLEFYSGTYTTAWINTNGNLSFSSAISTYTPTAFPGAPQPMIAPYWADVDTRTSSICNTTDYPNGGAYPPGTPCANPPTNGIWWSMSPGQLVITWDHVGFFQCHATPTMTAQMILTAATCGGSASGTDFDVEFRYNQIGWETGDASGGDAGFGGTPAQAGFDSGDGVHYSSLPGSRTMAIANNLVTMSNVGVPGVWRFAIRSGTISEDAGVQSCGVGACMRTVPLCDGGVQVPCTPGSPAPEQCDGMDHNCNGIPNDGQISCGVGACMRTVPMCNGNVMNACVPGMPQPERCNGIDDNCNGVVDEGCGPDVIEPDVVETDATDARDAASPLDVQDARCLTRQCLLLEGRAGPWGSCTCGVPGHVPRGERAHTLALLAAVALLWRRRNRASESGSREATSVARR